MIGKELSEIIDALAREKGESMLPYQELELLGYSPLGESDSTHTPSLSSTTYDEDDEEYDEYDSDEDSQVDEEYEFDDDDEEYTLLSKVLRLTNCRKKYLA